MTTPAVRFEPLAVLRRLWAELPLLAAGNLLAAIAAVPSLAAAFTGHPLAVPLLAALPGAIVATALCSVSVDIAAGRHVAWPAAVSRLAASIRPGIRIGLPLGLVATAALGTLLLGTTRAPHWLLASLAVDGIALILLTAAAPFALLLASRHHLRGRRLWLTALSHAAHSPAATLASLFLIAVTAVLVALLGPATLLVLPAPVALLVTATVTPRLDQPTG